MKHRHLVNQLQAGADDTRIRILELVARGAPTATEVNTHLGMSQPRVAHHLKILVSSGLLTSQRDGRFMRYTLPTSGFEAMLVELILAEALGGAPVGTETSRKARPPAVKTVETGPVAALGPVSTPEDPAVEEAETGGSTPMEDFLL